MYDDDAKKRQRAAGGSHSEKALVENFPQADSGKARDKAGKAVGVSGRSVDFATKVLKQNSRVLIVQLLHN